MKINDTIVAAATPYGYGGIAVVRISGNKAEKIAQKICQTHGSFKNRHATKVTLYDQNRHPFDSAVVLFYKSPNSYTGEDVVEISCHGNPTIVEKIVGETVDRGGRLAEPGEFTQRAFINGKLDLVQAESVAAVIQGDSERSNQLSHRVLAGELSNILREIKKSIIKALSYVEFELDISEDDLLPNSVQQIKQEVASALLRMKRLTESFNEGRLLNRGATVVIAGPPNIGKSTLFNMLLNENRSIVSTTPGTTRDVVDASVVYDGMRVFLTDTAGIRDTGEEIEHEGIRRASEKIKSADLVLNMFDINTRSILKTTNFNNPTIPVLNKCDLYSKRQIKTVNNSIENCVCVSAKTGSGIAVLKNVIKKSLQISNNNSDAVYLITQRQYDIAKDCARALKRALLMLKNKKSDFELLSIELRDALDAIDKILGKTTSSDILNNIFSNFCVGK